MVWHSYCFIAAADIQMHNSLCRSGQAVRMYVPPSSDRPTTMTLPHPVRPAESVVPTVLRDKIIMLFLHHYPYGLVLNRWDRVFIRRLGTKINCAKLGFKNSVTLVRSLSDIVTVKELAGGGCRLHICE